MFRSVPVTAELQGMATIGGKTGELKMTIDYTNFVEVTNVYCFCLMFVENDSVDLCWWDRPSNTVTHASKSKKDHIEGVSAGRGLWPSLRPLVQKVKKFKIYDLPFQILKTRCDGRQMVDGVPTVPEQLSYTAEVQKIIIFIVF